MYGQADLTAFSYKLACIAETQKKISLGLGDTGEQKKKRSRRSEPKYSCIKGKSYANIWSIWTFSRIAGGRGRRKRMSARVLPHGHGRVRAHG